METYDLTITKTIKVTEEDIDDIMSTALEGGINYWCNKAEVFGKRLGEYASEQIARGGVLKLYDTEENEMHVLTRSRLLKGIKQAIEGNYFACYNWFDGNAIDTCMVDAEVADVIIQLALFGDIVYG